MQQPTTDDETRAFLRQSGFPAGKIEAYVRETAKYRAPPHRAEPTAVVHVRTLEVSRIPVTSTRVVLSVTSPTRERLTPPVTVAGTTASAMLTPSIVGTWKFSWTAFDANARIVGTASGTFEVVAVNAPLPSSEVVAMASAVEEST